MFINERPEEDRNPVFDNEASLKKAKSVLPLHRLMQEHGHNPPGEKWGPCPFCKKKDTARIKAGGDQEFFKCANSNCPSATSEKEGAWTEVHYLKFVTGLNQKDAFIAYLKEAGVWKERTKFKKPQQDNVSSAGAASPAADQAPLSSATPVDSSKDVGAPGVDESSKGLMDGPQSCGSAPGTPAALPPSPSGQEQSTGAAPPESAPAKDAPASSGSESSATTPPAPDAALAGASNAEAASTSKLPGPEASTGPVKSPKGPFMSTEPDGWMALREFFSRLTLSNADRDLLFTKRGLKWLSSHALRFRSNPKTNEAILRELLDKYGPREMLASGLWLGEDRKNRKPKRPNSQFYGYGVKGKKKASDEDTQESAVGDFVWGWINPILIPYFDENGELVGLRPHKGMGRSGTLAGTPQLYIPRGAGGPKDGAPEVFYTVVLTEGEFKAGGLWQSLGVWRTDGKEPIGVGALPGISFGRNYEIREALEDWLRRVKCREVIVAFDNEEKGDPNLESYKSDRRKRFEAQKWARYLSASLSMKLHIIGKVGMLPNSWRNSKGKADWDGAAAEMAGGSVLEVVK